MPRNLQIGGRNKRPTLSSLTRGHSPLQGRGHSPLQGSTHAASPHETISPLVHSNASFSLPEDHPQEDDDIALSPTLTPLRSDIPSPPPSPVVSQNNNDGTTSRQPGEADKRELVELIEEKKRCDKTARDELVHIIHSHFDGPYTCWTGVAVQTLKEWWKMFKLKCRWDTERFSDEEVFKAFNKEGSNQLRKTFDRARRNKKKPVWIKDNFWTAMLAIWENDEFKKKSNANKDNRRVATDKGIPPYRGGSISTTIHKKLLVAEKNGTDPSPKEIFQRCYQKKDGTGSLDPYAQQLLDNYDMEVEKQRQAAAAENMEGPIVIDENQCWIKVAGDLKKGKVRCMGSEAPTMLKRARRVRDSTTTCGSSDAFVSTQQDMMETVSNIIGKKLSEGLASLDAKVTNVQQNQEDMRRDITALGETVQLNKEIAIEESRDLEKYVDKTIDGAVMAMRLDNDEMKSGLQKSMIDLLQNYFSQPPSSS